MTYSAEVQARYWKRLREAGECYDCRAPVKPGRRKCTRCLRVATLKRVIKTRGRLADKHMIYLAAAALELQILLEEVKK